jgi:hypothetical protein
MGNWKMEQDQIAVSKALIFGDSNKLPPIPDVKPGVSGSARAGVTLGCALLLYW